MVATQDIALNNFFRRRIVIGGENLPLNGSVVLAPTHRSRWDALMLTMALVEGLQIEIVDIWLLGQR